jgi:chromosome partitioning protein
VAQIKRQINPSLAVSGILLTLVDRRVNLTRDVIASIEQAYGKNIRIFGEHIPRSVKAAECSAQGVSIYAYDPNGKVAAAYNSLTEEVMCCG